jgi:hypothetical protein
MKNEIIAHNVGFNRPFLTHSCWIAYLFECAAQWNAIRDGQAQALNVQRQAIAAQKNARRCPVCKAAAQ